MKSSKQVTQPLSPKRRKPSQKCQDETGPARGGRVGAQNVGAGDAAPENKWPEMAARVDVFEVLARSGRQRAQE